MRSFVITVLLMLAISVPLQAQDTIKPGSVVNITILGSPELSQNLVVNEDGTTNYPILGSFRVTGMAPDELAELLTRVVSRFLDRPRVFVTMTDYRIISARVTGAVNNPGEVEIKAPADLLDAIAQAGGTLAQADLRRVTIISQDEGGSARQEVVNLLEYSHRRDELQDRILIDIGDLVLVPTLKADSYIRVLGEVNAPGPYVTDIETSLIDAIYLAGGFSRNADKGDITLIQKKDGKSTQSEYDFRDLLERDEQVPLVMPGDVIVIGQREFYEDAGFWVDWIRNVALLLSSYAVLQRL